MLRAGARTADGRIVRPVSELNAVLQRHVDAFNEGVRSGDFARMVAGFADDAEMRFEGVPGPVRRLIRR